MALQICFFLTYIGLTNTICVRKRQNREEGYRRPSVYDPLPGQDHQRYLLWILHWRNRTFPVDQISGTQTTKLCVLVRSSRPYSHRIPRPSRGFRQSQDIGQRNSLLWERCEGGYLHQSQPAITQQRRGPPPIVSGVWPNSEVNQRSTQRGHRRQNESVQSSDESNSSCWKFKVNTM